jgi:predicted Zn-dependent protease
MFKMPRFGSNSYLIIVLFLFLLITSAFLQSNILSQKNYLDPQITIGPYQSAKTALKLLGGLRSTAAAFLWIKIDRIHHKFYGELYEEKELIPLYRMTTWLDSHFVYAYYVGSFLLYLNNRGEEAIDFAEEGIRTNPNSGLLNFSLGQLYLIIENNPEKSERFLQKALKTIETDADRYNILATLLVVYEKLGDEEKYTEIDNELRGYPVHPRELEGTDEHDENNEH